MSESAISVIQRAANAANGETTISVDVWPVTANSNTYNRQGIVVADPVNASATVRVDANAGMSVAQSSDTLNSSGVPVTPQFATISLTATGTVVAAVAGKRVRVLAYLVVCTAPNAITWQTSTGNVPLSGSMSFGTSGGVSAPFSQVGHFQTVSGDSLSLLLGSATQVSGHLTYVMV